MKIAMCTDVYWPRINGVTVSIDLYAHALIRGGHEVVVVCPLYPKVKQQPVIQKNEPGPGIITVSSHPSVISKEDRLIRYSKLFWLAKQLDEFKPDVIHLNTEFAAADLSLLYAKTRHIPVVYTFHTLYEEYVPHYCSFLPYAIARQIVRQKMKQHLRRVKTVIAPTEEAAKAVKSYKRNNDIYLLPTGIDPRLFEHNEREINAARQRLETEYPALKGKRILLFAGRIVKEKNIEFLLRILPAIAAKHPEAALLIVGGGPLLEPLQNDVRRRGLERLCFFAGYRQREDLALIYAVSDIFVFPSLTETQGLVTIEAMMSGLPVVAIGSAGTKIIMAGNKGGFMTENNKDIFTQKILALLDDSALYRQKADEAKAHAMQWAIDGKIPSLVSIYQNAK